MGPGRFTFQCAGPCGRRLPEYFRGVFLFGVSPADHCVECEFERRVAIHARHAPNIRDVAAFLSAGYTQAQVADAWGISTRTVKRILARARKLGLDEISPRLSPLAADRVARG